MVKINGGEESRERKVPAIMAPGLQERAKAMLTEHNHRPDRKRDRKYLLAGLVRCAACGHAFTGYSTKARGTKYYYKCGLRIQKLLPKGTPHRAAYLSAPWLEGLV